MRATIKKIIPPKSSKGPYWIKLQGKKPLYGLFDKELAKSLKEGMEIEYEYTCKESKGKTWHTIKIIKIGSNNNDEAKGFLTVLSKLFRKWRTWILVGSFVISAMGLVGFAQFMYQEGIQQAGFGCFTLRTAGLVLEAFECTYKQERLLNRMKWFTYNFGWLSPFNWQSYKNFIEGTYVHIEAIRAWAISKNPALAVSIDETRVITVIDGDSVILGTGEEVRLKGIDSPEWHQPQGAEAKEFLTSLLLGKRVRVERHEIDKYGRVVASLYLNGEDVSQIMVKAGLAHPGQGHSAPITLKVNEVRTLERITILDAVPIDAVIYESHELDHLTGRTIIVSGKVSLYKGEPQVVFDSLKDIQVVE